MSQATMMTAEAEAPISTDANPSEPTEATATAVADDGQQQPGEQEVSTATDESQAASETGEESEGDKPKDDEPGEYEFKAPEGREFDPEVIAEYSAVAKELGLSQENAQKMLDRIAPALEAKNQRIMQEARAEWADSARSDKEFGGQKLNESLATARKAIDQFGTPELRKLLDESGLGDHPEVIRAFWRAGKAISEDSYVVTGQQAPGPTDPAQRLYPNQNQ